MFLSGKFCGLVSRKHSFTTARVFKLELEVLVYEQICLISCVCNQRFVWEHFLITLEVVRGHAKMSAHFSCVLFLFLSSVFIYIYVVFC